MHTALRKQNTNFDFECDTTLSLTPQMFKLIWNFACEQLEKTISLMQDIHLSNSMLLTFSLSGTR